MKTPKAKLQVLQTGKDGEARMRGALEKGVFHFIHKLRTFIVGNDAYTRK